MRFLLLVLPYAGLTLTAFSAVWGVTHELYTTGDQKKRHLTKAGKYSIAFTVIGLIISFNSAALKTITDNQDKAETRDAERQKTQEASLKELQRFNALLFNINRGQYPIGNSISMNMRFRVSIQSPLLKKHATNIQKGVEDLLAIANERKVTSPREPNQSWWNWALDQKFGNLGIPINKDGSVGNEMPINDRQSPLFPQDDFDAERFVSQQYFYLAIFDKNEISIDPPLDKVDLRLSGYYAPTLTDSAVGRGMLAYLRDTREYETFGPVSSVHVDSNNGRLISYLDLPGTTLLIRCPSGSPGSSTCEHISIDEINLYTPVGFILRLEKGSFERATIDGENVFVHRFESNREKFFERYIPKT